MDICLDLGIPAAKSTHEFASGLSLDDINAINSLIDAFSALSGVINDMRHRGVDVSVIVREGDSDAYRSFGGDDACQHPSPTRK